MAPSTSTSQAPAPALNIPDTNGDAALAAAINKRVLPSRVRRGGPGVGQNDIDQMILETYERQRSSAIIPENTKFILTTDSKLVPPKTDDSGRPDLAKYFSRPDIISSIKKQREIQTPEFTPLSDIAAVGGRLRVRGEENMIDMSDEAYLNRHRRYEAFEKKQRRREKEKLVHEQYKLRQRLDELRGFDINAFAATGLPQQTVEERRKIMLETAEALDQRYATLLPPDPKRTVRRRAQSVGPSLARSSMADDPPPAATPRRRGGTPAPSRARKELQQQPMEPLDLSLDVLTAPKPKSAPRKSGGSSKARSKSKPRALAPAPTQQTPKITIKLPAARAASPQSDGGPPSPFPPAPASDPADPSYEPSMPIAAARVARAVPVLVAAARRNAQPKSRRTSRVPEPFGVKLPRSVEEVRDFEIPLWAQPGYVDDEDEVGSVDGPPTYDGELHHGPPPGLGADDMDVDEQ